MCFRTSGAFWQARESVNCFNRPNSERCASWVAITLLKSPLSGGFAESQASLVCIPRMIEVMGDGCFRGSTIAYLAFEFSGVFEKPDGSGSAAEIGASVPSGARDESRPVLRISHDSFLRCPRLRSVSLPSHAGAVAPSGFFQCIRLEFVGVDSPSRLKRLEPEAFLGCRALQVIVEIDVAGLNRARLRIVPCSPGFPCHVCWRRSRGWDL
jgi:hypothetical protein